MAVNRPDALDQDHADHVVEELGKNRPFGHRTQRELGHVDDSQSAVPPSE